MHAYLLGLIGTGTRASLTPPMHEAEAAANGLRLTYRAIDLTELGLAPKSVGNLVRTGAELGFDAFNITHPCKQLVMEYLDEVRDEAARIGAVNTVLIENGRLIGRNTDAIGFAQGFEHALGSPDLRHVVLVGAGGAGAALADTLASLGAQRLTIVDTDPARAAALAARIRGSHILDLSTALPAQLPELLGSATGVVNATPIGMHDHPGMPVPAAALRPELWVADAVYRPTITELIATARDLGCLAMPGGHMAVGQAVATFSLVTGVRADVARVRRHFAELVNAEGA